MIYLNIKMLDECNIFKKSRLILKSEVHGAQICFQTLRFILRLR